MTTTRPQALDTLAGAWRQFQMRTPVKLGTVENDRHYRAMVDFMNDLLDEIGDHETHPLIGLLEIVGCFVREYEETNIDIPDPDLPYAVETASKPSLPASVSRSESSPRTEERFDTPGAASLDSHPGLRLALPRPGGYADFMKRVEIDLPDETFAGLDRESAELAAEFRAAAAAKWYEVGRVSQEVAAQIAGVSRSEFLTILSRLQVSPMQESAEEALASARLLLQP
jgi:predicted HTH domain antitoxin